MGKICSARRCKGGNAEVWNNRPEVAYDECFGVTSGRCLITLNKDAIWRLYPSRRLINWRSEISFVKDCLPSDAKDEASRWNNG
ncbi:hypothetical protein Tco_0184597 [Tanacetum coccineum]|uniref:Uncharacterized protein n=1 Tax=Tanacetum coccineum TaxID=301880 RepID=A0ABQ4WBD8_9ASTR